MDLCNRILLSGLWRATSLRGSRCYYLAEKFQPKPKKQVFSFEDQKMHPADRVNKPKKLRNILENGEPVNIGFQVTPKKHDVLKRTETEVAKFEENSRLMKLEVDTKLAFKEFVNLESQTQIKDIVRYYEIFDNLFEAAQFSNLVRMEGNFGIDQDMFFGNILTPTQASSAPEIKLDIGNLSNDSFYWTVVLTCPDGNLNHSCKENIHWAVSNIAAKEFAKSGQEIISYLPPIPYRGTGFHRYVLLAFHHSEKIDMQPYFNQVESSCPLESRSFSTLDFYQKFEDKITPISLAFFQSQWDPSVTETFHSTLELKEPGFEWDCPPPYVPPFEKFPRFADISYFEQYHPDLYTRHERDTYLEKSWDKIWNREDYRDHVVSSEEDLELERREIAWRQDYNNQFLSDDEAYEQEIDGILKEFNYEKDKRKQGPMFGYLV